MNKILLLLISCYFIGCSLKGEQPLSSSLSLSQHEISTKQERSKNNIMGPVEFHHQWTHKKTKILKNGENLHCSAYLIHSRVYLTAAHCLENFRPSPSEKLKIESMIPYPEFTKNSSHEDHDIGLIILKKKYKKCPPHSLKFGDTSDLNKGDKLFLYAYGEPHEGKLQKAFFKLSDFINSGDEIIMKSEKNGTGLGDSGGPVFVLDSQNKKYLIGVNSRRVSKRMIDWQSGAIVSLITPEVKAWIDEVAFSLN